MNTKRTGFRLIFLSAAFIMLTAGILVVTGRKTVPESEKINIVTTLFPLFDIARSVGGIKTQVKLLLPPGMEAHAFEPKPSDIALINKSDIFIFTGKFMEPWAEDIIKSLKDTDILIVDGSTGVKLMDGGHDAPEISRKGAIDTVHSTVDPHYWLDFENTAIMTDSIAQSLIDADPVNEKYYRENANRYKDSLIRLDAEFKRSLKSCRNRTVIYGGHYAFGYLAKRYDLDQQAAYGVSPDSEPTALDLINLTEQIRSSNATHIFTEELISPRVAQTLSEETGTKILILSPAHNISREGFEKNRTFFSIMEDNLTNLKTGLSCN